jgi:predicted NBD/HSP70 family sugar kinase
MGDYNESVVLDAIRRASDGLSRVELVAATGLSAQTVSNICRRLLDRGLVVEAGKKGSGRPGKPRTVLQVSPAGGFAIGVHLDPAVVTYVVLDLVGGVVRSRRQPTPQVVDQTQTLADMSVAVERLVDDSGIPRDRILGLGVAVPGPIDPVAGAVVEPPHLAGWGRVPLQHQLSRTTGWPVVMDKDVIAAAIAERWAGAAVHSGNFLFFYLGTGSGMGAVVNDVVLRGVSGNAGEVGGLDANCTTYALVDEAIERGVLGPEKAPVGPGEAERSLLDLVALVDGGDTTAQSIIDGWARRVGLGVSAAATLVDAELIVFGGPIWPHLSRLFLPVIEPIVASSPFVRKMHETTVTGTALGDDVGAVGAACLVLDQILSAQPQSLLLA